MKLHLDRDNGYPVCGDGRVRYNIAPLKLFARAPLAERCAYCQRRFAQIEWPRPLLPTIKARHVPFPDGDGPGWAVIDRCPFCGKSHTHGWGSGGRVPHCADLKGGMSLHYILDCEGV